MHSKKPSKNGENDPTFIVGIIGCGSVGSKFVRELVKRNIVKPNQIKISSRTPSRAKQRCGLEVVPSNSEIASHCSILFLFVLPFHFRNFSREIRDAIQGSRPLVISSLAGFTPMYLQRALNTPFLITTGVDMPTIQIAAEHLDEEFPLASFATGDELVHFQEYFTGMFDTNDNNLIGNEEEQKVSPAPSTQSQIHLLLKPQQQNQEQQVQEQQSLEEIQQLSESGLNVNPFLMKLSDPKIKSRFHEAAFAAENLSNCGIEFLNTTITALKDWVALDPNFTKIQAKPEMFNNLWSRSFIPLSSLNRVELLQESGSLEQQMPVRYMLKRAFIRSLIGNDLINENQEKQINSIKSAMSATTVQSGVSST